MGYRALVTSGVVAIALSAPAFADNNPDKHEGKKDKRQASMQEIRDWPEPSRTAAKSAMEKYGQPDATTETTWIWHDNDPWKRTVVSSEPIDHNFPFPHQDVVLQTVNYEVPTDKIDEIVEFDGSVIVDRTAGEMSARCETEAGNVLALNLAHDIIEGDKDVEEARQASADAMEQAVDGQPPEIVQALAFDPPRRDVGDPDEALIQVAGR